MLFRNIRVLIGGEDGLGPFLIIAVGRRIGGGLHTVKKGVDEALGGIDLCGRPAVDESVIFRAVIVDIVALYERREGKAQHQGQGKAQIPQPAAGPPPGTEVECRPAQHHQEEGGRHGLGQKELVFPRHVARLLEEKQVLKHQRIIAELKLEPACYGKAQYDDSGDAVAEAGPAQKKVEHQPQQQHRRQIQKGDEGVLKITQNHGLAVDDSGKQK